MKRRFARRPHRRQAQPCRPTRKVHPLLNPFPLAVMTIGTLLVVFALTMTWLNAGEDSTSPPGSTASPIAMSSADTP